MRDRIPLLTLWTSLVFLLVATTVTGRRCFEQLLAINQGASTATGGLEFISPAWIIQQANFALSNLWEMCAAICIGIILITASSVWVSLSWRAPIARQCAPDAP